MVSFARARTRSWLSKLWPETIQPIKDDTLDLEKSKELPKNIAEQNQCYMESIKNGGFWFS